MASYPTPYERSRPVQRGGCCEFKLGSNRLCIYDFEHQIVDMEDDNMELATMVMMVLGDQRHPKVYTLPLAMAKATPSAISTALTSTTPALSLQNISHILGDLATSRNGVLAFTTFHCYLSTGTFNTSKFIKPAKYPHLTRYNSTNVGYSFELTAICIQMGNLLHATRFVELAHYEIRREFLYRPLVLADFLMIDKLAGDLDGFLIDWANAIENDTKELRDKKLLGLQGGLGASAHVRHALTGMTANRRIVRLIKDANVKAQVNTALPGTSTLPNPQLVNGSLIVRVVDPTQMQEYLASQPNPSSTSNPPSAVAGPSVQTYPAATTNSVNVDTASAPLGVVHASTVIFTVTAAAVAINGLRRRRGTREVSPFNDTRDLGRGKRERKPVARYH
ncbi:hypothetical protein GJ744_008325 [Endocarpon pusillum]|uniref:Uncharacterized protein n=1 Tax=Endocarpon pusillum TaxID=364733 RepID=A0A8H7E5M6_9EURO|nr:hypothetical protein GJ744_008325 [Endocarpon pusillum]